MSGGSIESSIPSNMDNCLAFCPNLVMGELHVAELCMRSLCTGPVETTFYVEEKESERTLLTDKKCDGAHRHRGLAFEDGDFYRAETTVQTEVSISVQGIDPNDIKRKVATQEELRERAAAIVGNDER